MDTARKGPIEPNSSYLSRGDPLDREERSGDGTTFFRGQKVRKGVSTCLYFSLMWPIKLQMDTCPTYNVFNGMAIVG